MVSESRTCGVLVFIVFTALLNHQTVFAQEAGSARPSDQPADLSTMEQDAPVIKNDDETANEATPQKVQSKDHEPTPQIKKKGADYDPRYQQGMQYIEHPLAARGLYRIDKNKIYYYRVKPTDTNQEASVRLGPYNPTNLVNPSYPSIHFDDIYTTSNIPMILYDNEIDVFKKFGRFGYKYGSGLYLAQGHGEFVSDYAKAAEPLGPPEQFTFLMFPFNVGGIYHFEYFKHQWVIPYGEAALDAFCFAELRNDDVNKFGAALGIAAGAHFSVGITVPLGHDARSFLDLDREYGITSIAFAAEFRDYVAFESKWNFSAPMIDAGFSVNY
jgi:hypothetical protein